LISLSISFLAVLGIFELIQIQSIDNITLVLIVTFLFFIMIDTVITLWVLGEPLKLPFIEKIIDKFMSWTKYLGIPQYKKSSESLLNCLTKKYRKLERYKLARIRNDIEKNNIYYLLPLEPSCKQWGELFSIWGKKLKRKPDITDLRWALLSDLYLYQERIDLSENRFATELNLYAKTILANLYLSVTAESETNKVIWVITKMFPTDWPLCNSRCLKDDPYKCISGSGTNDEIFLNSYLDSLRQCATLFNEKISFRRITVISRSDENKFNYSYNSHKNEYKNKLHESSLGKDFGNTKKIIVEDNVFQNWPALLNDVVFYGSQRGGAIIWEWVICTSYVPRHPVILLRIFNLLSADEKILINQEFNDLYISLKFNGNDRLRSLFTWFEKGAVDV